MATIDDILSPASPRITDSGERRTNEGVVSSGKPLRPLTYEELRALQDEPQEPNDDISGGDNAPAAREAGKAGGNGERVTGNDAAVNPAPGRAVQGGDAPRADRVAIARQSEGLAERVQGYNGILRVVNQLHPQPSDEDLEREARRDKRERLLAAIGDGLGAFHEAYSRTRGVEPVAAGGSMSGMLRKRRREREAERASREGKRADTFMRLAALKRREDTVRELARHREELERVARARAESEAKYKAVLGDDHRRNTDNQIENRNKTTASTVNKNNATASAARSRAADSRRNTDNTIYNRNRNTSDQISKRGKTTKTTTKAGGGYANTKKLGL